MRNRMTSGILALVAIGAYYAWRNRFEIQRYLDKRGIRIPEFGAEEFRRTIRSGVERLRGEARRDEFDEGREAV